MVGIGFGRAGSTATLLPPSQGHCRQDTLTRSVEEAFGGCKGGKSRTRQQGWQQASLQMAISLLLRVCVGGLCHHVACLEARLKGSVSDLTQMQSIAFVVWITHFDMN